MKPETIERRAKERAEAMILRRATLRARLSQLADTDPEGIWKELLEVHDRGDT